MDLFPWRISRICCLRENNIREWKGVAICYVSAHLYNVYIYIYTSALRKPANRFPGPGSFSGSVDIQSARALIFHYSTHHDKNDLSANNISARVHVLFNVLPVC